MSCLRVHVHTSVTEGMGAWFFVHVYTHVCVYGT
jgi:hypothetical protein